ERRRRDRGRGGPPRRRGDRVAEQRPRHDPADRRQRDQREGERRQQPRRRRLGQSQRIGAGRQADRQQPGEQRRGERRRQRAEDERRGDRDKREGQHLGEAGEKDQPGRRAEAFQRGDRLALAGDKAGDPVADAADQEGGDPDQRQEQADAREKALQRRRRLGGAAQAPARLGKSRLRRGD